LSPAVTLSLVLSLALDLCVLNLMFAAIRKAKGSGIVTNEPIPFSDELDWQRHEVQVCCHAGCISARTYGLGRLALCDSIKRVLQSSAYSGAN
jgi:hypothetical protein